MSLPLREPFFLKGRTSVVQRAVIISLVLGGLALAAAWATVAVYFAGRFIGGTGREVEVRSLVVGWAVSVPLLINLPINYWNRRGWWWTCVSIPAAMANIWGFTLWVAYVGNQSDAGDQWKALASIGLGIAASVGTNNLLLLRWRRKHIIAWLASGIASTAPTMIYLGIAFSERSRRPFGMSHQLWEGMFVAAVTSAWFASMSIPWGIPFWWPPEKDAAAATDA